MLRSKRDVSDLIVSLLSPELRSTTYFFFALIPGHNNLGAIRVLQRPVLNYILMFDNLPIRYSSEAGSPAENE